METFRTYLLNNGDALNTIRNRENTVADFIAWNGKKTASYKQLMDYVFYCKQKGNTPHTIRLKIKNLEYYFDYLILEKVMKKNPVKEIKIKGGTKKLPEKLLTSEELMEIYNLQSTHGLIGKRNKVLLSLVVFQAAGSKELGMIELTDLDLLNGKITIPAARTTNTRTLDLKPQQLLLMQDYLMNVRPEILKESGKQSDRLVISQGKGTLLQNSISILLKKLRPQYPKLKSLQQIRQSVISEWLKEHGLRKAQYMAGHRYVSSTERYEQNYLEGLKKELKSAYVL